HQAAQVIDLLPEPVAELWRKHTLTDLPSIGGHIAEKIGEIVDKGSCAEHERLSGSVPRGILELLQVEGLGPKTIAAAWKRLEISDLNSLAEACRSGRICDLPHMGEKRAAAIVEAIERHRNQTGRTPLHHALLFSDTIVARLSEMPEVMRAEAAGSLR